MGAGVYGWSKAESVAAAVRAVNASSTQVEHVILVGYDAAAQREIEAALG